MLKISTMQKALTIACLISTTLAIAPVRAEDGGLEDPRCPRLHSTPWTRGLLRHLQL
jgi:hypothetical protein